MMKTFDLRPPPNVLVALTYTSMKPIDALCELVDNAIDSFVDADIGGRLNPHPIIDIHLPTLNDLNQGQGMIRVRDNGPGMTLEQAERALTAGCSSHNAFDRLGLFGMGLNIATGKFSRVTRLITATADSSAAVEVSVDLAQLVKQHNYVVQPREVDKALYFKDGMGGTIIELAAWWPQGNSNRDFPRKLIQYGPGKLRNELGRRYATLLRPSDRRKFTIRLREENCVPFEHCVWGANRYVLHRSQQIPARFDFNKLLKTQRRCEECNVLVEGDKCPFGPSHIVRTIEERVRGWVGVQRYDDPSHFGIDLIRRGRAIRVLEKDAFFKFTDELGEESIDYPIDNHYGRIVGEVHIDHVPVDFTKQDFNRSSLEWVEAMEYVRGKSSLQAKQDGASQNSSPMMKIYTGYRRVRKIGLPDMYMGYVDDEGKPQRIDRQTEQNFLELFKRKEPGYYDDAKWWEKVEEASRKIDIPDECPNCNFQVPKNAETCDSCGHILRGKDCVHCGTGIPKSAQTCPHCGESQAPEGPWVCGICRRRNPPDADVCRNCNAEKGTQDPFALEFLRENSVRDESLSRSELHIVQSDGEPTQKFDLVVMSANLRSDGLHLPIVCFNSANPRALEIFIDRSHSVFGAMQVRPEHMVAMEAASRLFAEGMSQSGMAAHTIAHLQFKILQKYWGDISSDDVDEVRKSIHSLLDDIREKMPAALDTVAEDVFNDLSDAEIRDMLTDIRSVSADVALMSLENRGNGAFMRHIPPETVVSIFKRHSGCFFGGKIWNAAWDIPGIPPQSAESVQREIREIYLNCLEDCVSFLRYRQPRRLTVRRARLSHEFLLHDLDS